MIKVKELVDNLIQTELHNLSMKTLEGDIKPNRLEQVINNINLGLTELYSRFTLKTVEAKYITQKHQRLFSPVVKTADEILEVLSVYDGDCKLDNTGHRSYSRPNASNGAAIKLNYSPEEGSVIRIVSKANHRRLNIEDYHNNAECELPLSYISALYYFVAHRMFTSIVNQLDGDLSESQRWYQLYLAELASLTDIGITADDLDGNEWFKERGFV